MKHSQNKPKKFELRDMLTKLLQTYKSKIHKSKSRNGERSLKHRSVHHHSASQNNEHFIVTITQTTTNNLLNNININLIICPENLRLTFLFFMAQQI